MQIKGKQLNKYYQQYKHIVKKFEHKAKVTLDEIKPICLTYSRFTKDIGKSYEKSISSCWQNGDEVMKYLFRLHAEVEEVICSGDNILTLYRKFNGE